ncbi:MAG: lipoprotein signal peptidase [Bacteroidetes bacterium]|nr:MAG: lipoprotein signal peptidase [Bacteroidota bacterium]
MKKSLLIVLAVLIADQALKLWVKTTMGYNHSEPITSWFHIHFIENPGMAFGLEWGGNTGKIILSIARLFAIGGIFIWLKRSIAKNAGSVQLTAIALIFAGAVGNMIDSAFYGLIFDTGLVYNAEMGEWVSYTGISQVGGGYTGFLQGNVVDMLYFPIYRGFLPDWVPFWGGEHFVFFRPIFNLADSAITVGVILLLFFQRKKKAQA